MNTAWQKYDYTQKYLNYAEETLRQISKKYSLGASNLSEYNSALDSYVSALSKHSIAKYEYFFKSKIVELYIQPWNCTTEY
jgi:Outer membrane efflux protein.